MSGLQKPYVGLLWRKGMLSGPRGLAHLQSLASDLKYSAEKSGIPTTDVKGVELWETAKSNAFFVGDTSSLPSEGWTKLATL